MIKLAIHLKIANLSELCIDGTRVLADANKYKTWTAKRLAKALEQLDAQIAEALETLEVSDSLDKDLWGEDVSADRLPAAVRDLKSRREQLEVHMETLKQMDETRQKNGSKGPAQIPKTDPDSRILPNKEGGYAPNYTPMATTETQGGLIVDADVLIGNVEHHQLGSILETVVEEFGSEGNVADRVLADSAYTTGENLSLAEEKEVELLGPLAETKCENNPAHRENLSEPVATDQQKRLPINPQTKCFDKSAFVYDETADCYYCPAGKQLPHRCTEKRKSGEKTIQRKVYTCQDCIDCPLVKLCRKNPEAKRGREVRDDEYEPARRRHRQRMKTEAAQEAYSRRQHSGEPPFAVIKCCFDLRRFLLRGEEGAKQEWRWASTAFNLKKIMSHWLGVCADLPSPGVLMTK